MDTMTPYRLRRTLRYADGREGTSLDNRTVHAPDVESAIELAKLQSASPPGMSVVSLVLCAPGGEILWSSTDGGAFAPSDVARAPSPPGP